MSTKVPMVIMATQTSWTLLYAIARVWYTIIDHRYSFIFFIFYILYYIYFIIFYLTLCLHLFIGGIEVKHGGSLTVDNLLAENNFNPHSVTNGGAVIYQHTESEGTITITNSVFSNNSNSNSGGGVFIWYQYGPVINTGTITNWKKRSTREKYITIKIITPLT